MTSIERLFQLLWPAPGRALGASLPQWRPLLANLLAHLALKGLQRRQGEDGKWNAPKCLAAMVLA